MRDFFEELRSADDMGEFILAHKGEAVKIAAIAVAIVTALLLFVYRGGDEVEIGGERYLSGGSAEDGVAFSAEESAGRQEGSAGTGTDISASGTDTGTSVTGIAQTGEVYVDVAGAVKNPMVVKLPAGSRVEDAITKAGGLTEEADLTTINRAEVLSDGQKIHIPTREEVRSGSYYGYSASVAAGSGVGSGSEGVSGSGMSGSTDTSGRVNINTADLTQLQSITGVGPATAQKIIDYRTQNGRFSSVEDLKNVSGIGDKTFEKMRDQVTV